MNNQGTSKKQYVEHAKLHYYTALKQLEYADRAETDDWNVVCCARAQAEASAGLLALELSRGVTL